MVAGSSCGDLTAKVCSLGASTAYKSVASRSLACKTRGNTNNTPAKTLETDAILQVCYFMVDDAVDATLSMGH